jgi:hypothetical protein
MQQNNIWSIAIEACTKEILKEVCCSDGPRWILHTQSGTRFMQKSTNLSPILFNQEGTILQSFMISTALNPTQSVWNSLIPFWQTICTIFLWQSVLKVVYVAQIQRRECQKLLTNGQLPLYFLVEAIPGFIYIKFYHWVNNHG